MSGTSPRPERVLALVPNSAEGWFNRGMTHISAGDYSDAISSFDRAIAGKPDFSQAHLARAKLLLDLRRPDDALESIDRLLAIASSLAEAWLGRSNILFELARHEEALAACDRALTLKADLVEAWHGRGNVLHELKRHQEAISAYNKALALNPNFAGAWHGQGIVLYELKRYQDALVAYDKGLALRSDLAEAWLGRGNVLTELNRYDEAFTAFDRALALRPDFVEAWVGRGNAFIQLRRPEMALASFDAALTLKPDHAGAHWNKSSALLLFGDLETGWQEYEWRWETKDFPNKRPKINAPSWRGQDLTGRHVMVFSEQGLGDIIQFARYLPLLIERKAKVTFFTSKNLVRLLRSLGTQIDIVSDLGAKNVFDFQCALMSLPHCFNTNASSIPNKVPYLAAEGNLNCRWKERIDEAGFKIGIAWQGNPEGKVDKGRSIPLEEFIPLTYLPNVRLISLQKHHGLDHLTRLPSGVKIETLGDDFDSGPDAFIDTAAVINNLDVIITSDTSIAHLAGALGRLTWVALQYVPDWRWMLDRDDSPWYPTVRLFRQTETRDWGDVVERVRSELDRRIAALAQL